MIHEALKAFASLDPEIEEQLSLAYSDTHGMLTIRDFAVSLVRGLKAKGYGVYYLSNFSSKAYQECADSLAFMEYMDGGLLSFQARMTKPNPDFYKLFLARFDLRASECIFIDDTPENVEEANRQGFHGILYTTYAEMTEKLSNALAH